MGDNKFADGSLVSSLAPPPLSEFSNQNPPKNTGQSNLDQCVCLCSLMFYVLLSFSAHVEDVLSSMLLMVFCYSPANCACKSPGCALECEAFNVAGCVSVFVLFFFY